MEMHWRCQLLTMRAPPVSPASLPPLAAPTSLTTVGGSVPDNCSFMAAYFFLWSSSMLRNTPSSSISSRRYRLFTWERADEGRAGERETQREGRGERRGAEGGKGGKERGS